METPTLQPDRINKPIPPLSETSTSQTEPGIPLSLGFLTDPSSIEHLTELRNRLLLCITVTIAAIILSFFWAPNTLKLLLSLAPHATRFVQLTTGEAFIATVKVSLLMGIVLTLPVWLFHVIRFVFPGLHTHERRWAMLIVSLGLCLFLLGSWFSVSLVAPITIAWLVQFGQDLAVNQIGLANYLDFVGMLTLLIGSSFELPMVILGLVWVGILKQQQLFQYWRPIVVGLFIAAAIITPSQDPFSMTLVGVAMCLLFVLSLWLLRFVPMANKSVVS